MWGQRGRPAGTAGGAGQWAALPPALRLGRGGFTGGGPSGQARYVLNAGAVTLRHALPECAACRAATNCTRQQLRGALRRTGGGRRRRVRAAWWRAWQPRWRVLDCDALARKRRSEAPDCNLSGWVLSLFGSLCLITKAGLISFRACHPLAQVGAPLAESDEVPDPHAGDKVPRSRGQAQRNGQSFR